MYSYMRGGGEKETIISAPVTGIRLPDPRVFIQPDADGQRRGQLMHHMGQLWLRAEVRDLESRVRRRGAAFSPYLAVDGDALIYHIHLVKQLVGARKFIVLIPSVVVSALDKLKREVSRAREAIRWLESQFQRGNRFLRAQRNHEQLPLPLIKYPKKKDREAWLFFQVLECCHYFSQQTGVHEIQPDISVVTLLTGHKDEHNKMDFSPVGVAKSAGEYKRSLSASTIRVKTYILLVEVFKALYFEPTIRRPIIELVPYIFRWSGRSRGDIVKSRGAEALVR
uniref:PIN domain-containing protein n=1 Tax=Timema tahoe TaxID=61484 RepID=A0A7R9FHP1_9NEOP|nr:unnamed protein product [Timema tahoe]